jgi:histidinol phosphatase-like enzyme
MFKRCAKEIKGVKWSRGFYVGDKMSDLKAAMKVGARPVLVRTGYGLETEKQLNKYTYKEIKKKTYVFDSLADFADQL